MQRHSLRMFLKNNAFFAFAMLVFPSSSVAEESDRWTAWQRLSTSDPTFPVEIQFLPPKYPNKKTGEGTWYYRVRNVSADQGICVEYILRRENSDGTSFETKQSERLKPGEQQRFWQGSWTVGTSISAVRVVSSVPYENGTCRYSSVKKSGTDSVPASMVSAAGSPSIAPTAASCDIQTYIRKGVTYCTPNCEVKQPCACPPGAMHELKFPQNAAICHCREPNAKWDPVKNRCLESKVLTFPANTPGATFVPMDTDVPRKAPPKELSFPGKKPASKPVCGLLEYHPWNSCICPAGSVEVMLSGGRGVCSCTPPLTVWSAQKRTCISTTAPKKK